MDGNQNGVWGRGRFPPLFYAAEIVRKGWYSFESKIVWSGSTPLQPQNMIMLLKGYLGLLLLVLPRHFYGLVIAFGTEEGWVIQISSALLLPSSFKKLYPLAFMMSYYAGIPLMKEQEMCAVIYSQFLKIKWDREIGFKSSQASTSWNRICLWLEPSVYL